MDRHETEEKSGDSQHPKYWDLLSTDDKASYEVMRGTLSSPSCKNRRNKSLETFTEIIDTIHNFVVRNDSDDWKRALVCGACWLGKNAIAINTRQLRLLIAKCKSSINGSFQQMGYSTVPTGAESSSSLIKYFPFLKDNFSELRQWTVRYQAKSADDPMNPVFVSPAPEVVPTNVVSMSMMEIPSVADIDSLEYSFKPGAVEPEMDDSFMFLPIEREPKQTFGDHEIEFFGLE